MKTILPLGGIVFCFLYMHASAQVSPPHNQVLPYKSSLFSRLPEHFRTNTFLLNSLFEVAVLGKVKFPMSDNRFFEGFLAEKVYKNENTVTINVRSSNYDGALLTLSRITQPDLAVTYTGRILSIRYGDVFMLRKEEGGLFFAKDKQSHVLVE